MFTNSQSFDDKQDEQEQRDTYRVRVVKPNRRRHAKSAPKTKSSSPGGIRQRRNKHWSW